MIEKINLQLDTFKNESESLKARQDILKGIKTPFWKWIVKVLETNEARLTNDIIEDNIDIKSQDKAKALVNISKMVRGLPERQLDMLDVNPDSGIEEEEDFFQEEDPYEKTEKEKKT